MLRSPTIPQAQSRPDKTSSAPVVREQRALADVEATALLLTYGNQKDFQIVLRDITERK